MVSVWYQYGISMVSVWYQYGISMVSVWYQYGISSFLFKSHFCLAGVEIYALFFSFVYVQISDTRQTKHLSANNFNVLNVNNGMQSGVQRSLTHSLSFRQQLKYNDDSLHSYTRSLSHLVFCIM